MNVIYRSGVSDYDVWGQDDQALLTACFGSLQVCQIVPMPAHHFPVGSNMTTLHLCSDGTYLYWIWSPASLNEKTQKGHSVFMDVFQLVVSFPIVSLTFSLLSIINRMKDDLFPQFISQSDLVWSCSHQTAGSFDM